MFQPTHPFYPVVRAVPQPGKGILSSPHVPLPVNPFLNRPLFNPALVLPRGPLPQPQRARPALKPYEVLNKLNTLQQQLQSTSTYQQASKEFTDLLNKGLTKQNATQFYEVLEKVATVIGNEEYNSLSTHRILQCAFFKKFLFSEQQVAEIVKWKAAIDELIKPKLSGTVESGVKRANEEANGGEERKKPKTENMDLHKRIELLEDEVNKLKEGYGVVLSELEVIKKRLFSFDGTEDSTQFQEPPTVENPPAEDSNHTAPDTTQDPLTLSL